jgi:ABC-type branched-subunit amino acid transport system substrate-binding protein
VADTSNRHSDDFVERAQARIERISGAAEELREELGLPPGAEYEVLSMMYDPHGSRSTSSPETERYMPRVGRMRLVGRILPIGVALLVGLFTLLLGQFIAHAPGANVLSATTAILVVMVVGTILILVLMQMTGPLTTLAPALGGATERKAGWQSTPLMPTFPGHISHQRREADNQEIKKLQLLRPARRPAREKGGRERHVLLGVTLSLVAACASLLVVLLLNPLRPSAPTVMSEPDTPFGLSVDGSKVFDIYRPDASLKLQAARDVAAGDMQGAKSLWDHALSVDSSDAEALIYEENLRVIESHLPYITLVVGTYFAQEYTGDGRNDLQGAYVEQKEHNDQVLASHSGVLLRLLIASAGTDNKSLVSVAQQVVQAAHKDSTIVGVIGWPTSGRTLTVLKIFARAHIPLVSPTATSDLLTGISPYFFRVAPTDTQQGAVAAEYVKNTLHDRRVAVFSDPNDAYSASLAKAFTSHFSDEGHITIVENYTVGNPVMLRQRVQDALIWNPDLFYFAGYVDDASVVLQNLPPCTPSSCLLMMGGDALDVQYDYSLNDYKSYYRLRFTTFAFQDQRKVQGLPQNSPFFREYAAAFDPQAQYRKGSYGYNFADTGAMLAYDATRVLLYASDTLIAAGKAHFTPTDLRQALSRITGSHAMQGVSGLIAFGPDGNVIGKQVLVLGGDAQGHTVLEAVMHSS